MSIYAPVWRYIALAAGALLVSPALHAAADVVLAVAAPNAVAPRIDGILDDAFWAGIEPLTAFVQASPDAGSEPSQRTELRLAHDGSMLYVAVRAFVADGAEPVARTLQRDAEAIEAEDHVALVLDPQGSGRNGFVFRVNALGAQRDGLVADGGDTRPEWDALWEAAATIDSEGWSVEFAVPLAALAAPVDGRAWGFNAERFMAGTGERARLYAATPEREIDALGGIGELAGITPTRSGWGLRLQPAIRWETRQEPRGDDGRAGAWRSRVEPSLDAQMLVTPTLTATLTLNTDFSGTELDDQNMSLSRFELFRPEKRSFFTQDSGRFSFGGLDGDEPSLLPFFSRRIGLSTALDAGLKVSGTAGPVELGAFGVQADAEAPDPDSTTGHARKARMAVVRGSTALGDHRFGAIATQGDPTGASGSSLSGVDYQFRSTDVFDGRTLEAYAWGMRSTNEGSGHGSAQGGRVDFPNVGFTGALSWQQIDESFRPALGFVQETGLRRTDGEVGWWHRSESGADVIPRLYVGHRERMDGREDSRYVGTGIEAANPRGDFAEAEYFWEDERVAEDFEVLPGAWVAAGEHRWGHATLGAGLAASRVLSGEAELNVGGFYDGTLRAATLKLAWRPSIHWTLTGAYNHQSVDLGSGHFDAKAASLRLDHASDTRSAQSLVVQHDNVSSQTVVGLRARWSLGPGREWRLAVDRVHPVREEGELPWRATLALVWALEV